MTTPKQLARELAQSFIADLPSMDGCGDEELIQFVLRKLNLEELIADKQRLDWLQQHGETGYWYEADDSVGAPFGAIRVADFNQDPIADDIRQAIDSAMKAEVAYLQTEPVRSCSLLHPRS